MAWLGPENSRTGIDCKRARTKAVMFWKPTPHHLRECLIHNFQGRRIALSGTATLDHHFDDIVTLASLCGPPFSFRLGLRVTWERERGG